MGVTEERENCNEIEVGIREDPPAERFEIEGDLPGMVELSVSGGGEDVVVVSEEREPVEESDANGTGLNEPQLSEGEEGNSSSAECSSASSSSSSQSSPTRVPEDRAVVELVNTEQYYWPCDNGVGVPGFENGFVPPFYQQQMGPYNPNMGGMIMNSPPAQQPFQFYPSPNDYMGFNNQAMIPNAPIGMHAPTMPIPAGPGQISSHLSFPPFGGFTGFHSNHVNMQMMVPTPMGMIPQQQGNYAMIPNMQQSFPQLAPPVNGFSPQFQQMQQQTMYSGNFNGDYNFGMVPFQHQQQFHQSFGGSPVQSGLLPTPAPWASHPVASDGMVFANQAEIPAMPYSWRNSSMDSSSCPTSPYTSSGSRGSPARFSFGSTDDSSSVSSTGMSPPHLPFLSKRQRYKRAVQSRIRGLVSKPVSVMDFETTFVMNGEELPYVMSVWDPTRPMKFLRPPPDLAYYVPPAVDDGDFFGGQQHMWQTKMVQFFARFQPDLWKMQAVPDFRREPADGWMGFTVTSKLRFCCRTCCTPWTSKQGKIVFGFKKDVSSNRGWIFMKIFGQICMKKQIKQCRDWKFQQPACYPEEIERAVLKLSDFIGYKYYRVPMKATIFDECKKSIRMAVGRSNGCNTAITAIENHHRKDLCQACIQGVCRQKLNLTQFR